MEVAKNLLECARNDPDFLKILPGGEKSGICGYIQESMIQLAWGKSPSSPGPKIAKQVKLMFFNYCGFEHTNMLKYILESCSVFVT